MKRQQLIVEKPLPQPLFNPQNPEHYQGTHLISYFFPPATQTKDTPRYS
jgi:hypothetical protein